MDFKRYPFFVRKIIQFIPDTSEATWTPHLHAEIFYMNTTLTRRYLFSNTHVYRRFGHWNTKLRAHCYSLYNLQLEPAWEHSCWGLLFNRSFSTIIASCYQSPLSPTLAQSMIKIRCDIMHLHFFLLEFEIKREF